MAKEFTLQQCVHDGCTINGHKRPVGAAAVAVDGAGNEFLSGAALALDQNGGFTRRHPGDKLIHLAHALAFADHAVLDVEFLLQTPILISEPFQVARVFNRQRGHVPERRHQLQELPNRNGRLAKSGSSR